MSIGITYESKMEDILNLKNDIFDMLLNHPKIATNKTINISKTKKLLKLLKKGFRRNQRYSF